MALAVVCSLVALHNDHGAACEGRAAPASVPALRAARDLELLQRWSELAIFTAFFRSHEGSAPASNVQPYDAEALPHFARCSRLFAALAIARYAGSAAGNLGGAALFQRSLAPPDEGSSLFARGGALPPTLAAAPAAINVVAMARCARAEEGHGESRGDLAKQKREESDGDDLM